MSVTQTPKAGLAALVFAVSMLAAPFALGVVVTGSTVGDPVWNRPVAGNPPTPPVSSVGTAVSYETIAFTVDATGPYVFQNTATVPANWDNYSFLYQNSFNPAAPFANVLIGNDDNTSIGLSGFNIVLNAGTPYIYVTTGFGNSDAGEYSLEITGPGNVLIPEPTSLAALTLTLGGLLVRRRVSR